jgi:hypothetical protein
MLEQYRNEGLAFQEARGREYFLHYTGQKPRLELHPIYERYADLFTLDAIQRLKGQYESTAEYLQRQRWGIKLLRAFAEEHFLEQLTKELTEHIAEFETRTTLRYDSKEMPFHRVVGGLAKEPDPYKRRQLNQQRIQRIGESHEWRLSRLQKLHDGSRTLGYDNYWTMVASWRDCHLSGYADQFTHFLEQTDSLYHRQLREVLPRIIGLPSERAERADVEYFLHLNQYAPWFPESRVVDAYRETLRALGIALDKQNNVGIDDVQRPRKHPRSVCVPIRVPEEIKLSLSLHGGPIDYQTMLHEGGHAQHYAWASSTLPVEFKFAGDPAVSEGYAFLFQHLMLDPLWLDELLDLTIDEEFITLSWLHKLFHVRRYAAKLNYERVLHTTGAFAETSQHYADWLTEATGFRYAAEEFLYDLDEGGYAAHYLRAWLLEVQLREYLKTRFGKKWWHSTKAARFLIELWNTGAEYTAEELASQADLGSLSLDHLMSEFTDALGVR